MASPTLVKRYGLKVAGKAMFEVKDAEWRKLSVKPQEMPQAINRRPENVSRFFFDIGTG